MDKEATAVTQKPSSMTIQIKPIVESPGNPVKGDLSDISPIVLGGATFNTQYNDNPETLSIDKILLESFTFGINTIDTSPYYGSSEELLGKALNKLEVKGDVSRDSIYICTKVGRLFLDEFDYSPEWIEKSVERSLKRLHTSYLDLVHLHDVEFVSEDKIVTAMRKLASLKRTGVIRHIGLSGYPVDFLYKMALQCAEDPAIGPLDSVLSYCNMNIQNSTLLGYYDKFIKDCKVRLINNASILSMSMLRSQETRSFHPAPAPLKETVSSLATMIKLKYKMELADVATRFAFSRWLGKQGVTLIGVSNLYELEDAIVQYWNVIEKKFPEDEDIFIEAQEFLGAHLNETWESGIKH